MICPVCKSDMVIVERNNIELDYCTGCSGVWFDSGELELLLESASLGSLRPFLDAIFNSNEAKSLEKKRRCPICLRKMKKVFIDEDRGILIDTCRERHGIWFDGGEVDHLLRLLAEKSLGKPGSQQEIISFLGEVFKSKT